MFFLTSVKRKKSFYGGFELSLLRHAQKHARRKSQTKIKKDTYLPRLVDICQISGALNLFCFGALRATGISGLGRWVI
jgi:hypothetical protein